MNKKKKEWATAPYKCNVCEKCKVYIEGPMMGHCVFGGPYEGYIRIEDVKQDNSTICKS